MAAPPLLWEPSAERRERAGLTAFMRWLSGDRGLSFSDYSELWRWSVDELEDFWAAIWEYFDVISSGGYERVLSGEQMPGVRWFEGAQLNYAEHIFRDRRAEETAILHASELRDLSAMTWGELEDEVARVAGGLRALGVERGDRVVAYLPNVPEAVIAFLACASIGAIWSSCSPDFGARSVIDRFAQIEPKVLFAVDGYRYGGKDFDRLDVVAALQEAMPTLRRTVVVPYLQAAPEFDITGLRAAVAWDELPPDPRGEGLCFERVDFSHPLWVLYSSGTTGLPKAIVHGHGGILLEQLKKGFLHLDLHPGERMFWFTTTGWMMWNFLVGCLLTDAAIVLYDGSPAAPDLGVLWRLAERTGMTCFGTSAGYLVSCMKEGLEPGRDHDLSALGAIGSTGSPLPPEGFRWVYEHISSDVWLFSTSGGTDVCTAFVGGCALLPVYEGELQCRALGAAVEAWDEQGRLLQDEVGELVLTKPMPSMPLFFWGDRAPDGGAVGPAEDRVGERLRESYFSMYPGIWRHGDWIRITPRGGAVIYGRSDSTINRQGVRMGTSEIYRAAGAVDDVVDALVVDVPSRDGSALRMLLFVVLRDGVSLDDELRARIKRRIREDCSPRHVPDEIHQVTEVPRTLSGKVLEVPVKKILMGTPPAKAASVDSLANPAALDFFVELASHM
jgi:acetoacetyl-CoA synthetase